jgi:putative ABC transport system permease protein
MKFTRGDGEKRKNELNEEIASHLQMAARDREAGGESREQARAAAQRELGNAGVIQDVTRDQWAWTWLENLLQDLRYGARMLRKNPGFTMLAVLTLALGIGANTAIFSVANAVLLKPVHAPEPDRVVMFMNTSVLGSGPTASEIEFNLWREQTTVLQDVSGYHTGSLYLMGVDQPHKAEAIFVTEDYFRLFGVSIAQGRSFMSEEERPNGAHVVVLSDAFWKSAFGRDSRIVGKVISFDGDAYEVVGITAVGVQTDAIDSPDVWVPFPIATKSDSQVHYFQAAGRLRPGVTLDVANAQLQLMTQEFRREYPNTVSARRGDSYSVQKIRDVLVRDVRLSVLALSAAVIFVLLIACANIANLLLVRAAGRTREMSIRMAVGGTRGRIIRQLLTESVLLSVVAGLFGLGLGLAGIHSLIALIPATIPRVGVNGVNITLDWRVLSFVVLVALSTGLLFGLAPALQSSGADLNRGLKEGGGSTGGGFRQNKARSLLAISEMSLALLLLVGAGLFIRTLIDLRSVAPGFDPRNLVTTRTPLDPKFLQGSGTDQTSRDVLRRLSAIPGVESAAFARMLPLDGDFNSLPIIVVGRPLNGPSHGSARWMVVSPSYFDVLKIPLLRGRFFTENDQLSTPSVAIINQTMARQLWPDGDPLNDSLFIGKGLGPRFEDSAREIVGIVGDVHDNGLGLEPQPSVFVPGPQIPDARWAGATVAWVVRIRGQSPFLNAAIQNELRQATGGLLAPPLRSMEEVMMKSTADESFNMLLMTTFGGSALLLAGIGIFGLMAYAVQQRTHEIGIRLALGAQRKDVLRLLVGHAAWITLIGVAIGLGLAFGLTWLLKSMLFGIGATDAATFIGAAILLTLVALAACYIPARRAMRVDPMVALRYE